ncbi:MAG: polyprenyl synthetase family protein [Gemmatimonadota bacterium]|nr:MAG: polyprenyl synthetase family protein [Gemmatimonadota bacterium]
MSELDLYLGRSRERVNRALAEVLDDYLDGVGDWLAAPIRYACEAGGKRFRPILFLAGYEVSGHEPNNRVMRLATALEIVHSYSLVHDDLPCMDDDDWRRGRATCHRAFGVERATIAAAAMVPLASWVMAAEARALGFSANDAASFVAELSEAAGPMGMVGGQVLDLIAEGQEVSGDQLGDIHLRKTGALIRCAARLGGRVGRLDQGKLAALTAYGERIGLAFQIADDLLDEVATPDFQGRDPRSDRELGKATYPGLFGTERSRAAASQLSGKSIAALRAAGIDSPALEGLAVHVVERDS